MSKNIVNQRFIDCINFLLESKKAPSKSFLAEKFNISKPKFSEILKERMNVGIDILMILVSEFSISSEWLLTGEGNMLKEAPPAPEQEVQPARNQDKYISVLEAQLKDKERILTLQEEKIADLERRLALTKLQ